MSDRAGRWLDRWVVLEGIFNLRDGACFNRDVHRLLPWSWSTQALALFVTVGCGAQVVFEGEGGGSTSGKTGSASSAKGGTSAKSGSSTTGMACLDQGECTPCATCAANNECHSLYAGATSPPAQAFVECFTQPSCMAMGNKECIVACSQIHPEGFELFDAYSACIACDVCAVSCEGEWYCDL